MWLGATYHGVVASHLHEELEQPPSISRPPRLAPRLIPSCICIIASSDNRPLPHLGLFVHWSFSLPIATSSALQGRTSTFHQQLYPKLAIHLSHSQTRSLLRRTPAIAAPIYISPDPTVCRCHSPPFHRNPTYSLRLWTSLPINPLRPSTRA